MVKNDTFGNMEQKVQQIETPTELPAFVAFDPFSAIVIEKLNERRDVKNKLRLFDEIVNDNRADVLFETENVKTVLFPGHKGTQHETWQGIKTMAEYLNKHGENVAFLPELKNGTSADAIVLFKGAPVVADFKYCITRKNNTIACDLEDGFIQASTVVLMLENMGTGEFKDAIDYLVRNGKQIGNIKLLNEYGKMLELTYNDLKNKTKFNKKIKGFL